MKKIYEYAKGKCISKQLVIDYKYYIESTGDYKISSIKSAVCKINIDSDIRLAMTAGVREVLMTDTSPFDPRVYLKQGRAYVKELVEHKIINVLGSEGKA